jgi:PAS domain S-box-containing protein
VVERQIASLTGILAVEERVGSREVDQGLYQNLVDNASDLIQSVGPDAHFIYVNQTWRRLLGYAEDEVAALTLWDIIRPDLLPKCRDSFQRVMSGEAMNNVETVFITREGNPITVEGNVACRTEGGKVVATLGIFRDITGRRKSEEALARSEARYRELTENTPVAIATTDIAGNFTFANGALCRAVGYSREEIIGRPFADFLHPEDRDSVIALFQGAFTHPQDIVRLEFRAIHKQGRVVYMSSAPTVLRHGDEISGFSAIMQDVTEHRRTVEALKESEKKYRGLVNNVKMGILRSTPVTPGKALEVNPAMELITGYSRDELLAMDIVRLYSHPEDREAIIRQACSAEGVVAKELRWRKKDGSDVLVLARLTPVKDENEEIIYLDAIIEDITERRRLEEAVRRAKEFAENIINSSVDGIEAFDLNFRYTIWNPGMERNTGVKREEVIGRVAFEAFPFIVESGEDEFFRAALQGKVSVARDRPYIVPQTGRTGFFEGYYSPLYGEGGRIEGGLIVIRNTTVQVLAQRELEEKNKRLDAQNEELQLQQEELMAQQQEIMEKTGELIKANHLKSQFLANMSHELRTPLNVIIGFTQLMVDGVPGKINAEQSQCLNDILDSSQHLLNLINEVLDLSKIESGKTELKLEDLDLTGLVPSSVRLIMPILRPKRQTIETLVSEALPPVRADKAKLGQVLRNLLANASKFSPEGSQILIKASRKDGWCHISIIDQGSGIKPEDQERIFEPFYQLDYTPTSAKAGTGLGLSVVKQIVERHGGRVWVESEYGRGSTFTFTLPLALGYKTSEETRA